MDRQVEPHPYIHQATIGRRMQAAQKGKEAKKVAKELRVTYPRVCPPEGHLRRLQRVVESSSKKKSLPCLSWRA